MSKMSFWNLPVSNEEKDYLMNTVKYKVNDVLQFRYDGGSNPGDVRLVLVKEISNGTVKAYDLEKHGPRNFKPSSMQNVTVVPSSVLTKEEIGGKYHTQTLINNIVKGLETNGKTVVRTEDELYVVFDKPKMPDKYEITFSKSFYGKTLAIHNKETGKTFSFDLNKYPVTGYTFSPYGSYGCGYVIGDNLIEALKKFLNT